MSSLGRVYSEPRVTPHGYWKTARGNAEDRERHGNTPRGEAIGISKLSSCDVTEIRCLHVLGATQRAIAEVFGVAQTTIGQVLRGETWRHVAS